MSKTENEAEDTDQNKDPKYIQKRQKLFSAIEVAANLKIDNTLENLSKQTNISEPQNIGWGDWMLSGAANAASYLTGYSKQAVETTINIVKDNPTKVPALFKTGYEVYSNNFYGDFKQLLKQGAPADIATESFLLQVIEDPKTAQFLGKPENVVALSKLVDTVSPKLIPIVLGQYVKNDLLKDLTKIGLDNQYINEKLTPIATEAVKNLLKNPKNLLQLSKVIIEMNSAIDSTQKQDKLNELLQVTDVKQIFAGTNLPTFLIQEQGKLTIGAMTALKSTARYQEISAKLNIKNKEEISKEPDSNKHYINEKLLQDTISTSINVIAQSAKDEAALTAIYSKLKPVILDNNIEEIAKNKDNPAIVAELERQSLIKKLELAGAVASLVAGNATLHALEEIPKLLENNAKDIGQLIENIQINYPNSTTNKFIEKTFAGKIEAAEATKLVDSLAKVTKIALPIATKLAKESLNDPAKIEELANIIDQTKKIINQEKPDKNQKNYQEIKEQNSQEIKNLINMLAEFKNKDENIKKIIDQELPALLKSNSKELGATLDVFLNQTKIGKKLQLDGQDILLAVSKKTPQLIDIAEAYAQGKYTAIIPKIMPVLADKAVLKLLIKGGVNYLTSRSISGNQNKDEVIKQAQAIGDNMNKPHVSKNNNASVLPKKQNNQILSR